MCMKTFDSFWKKITWNVRSEGEKSSQFLHKPFLCISLFWTERRTYLEAGHQRRLSSGQPYNMYQCRGWWRRFLVLLILPSRVFPTWRWQPFHTLARPEQETCKEDDGEGDQEEDMKRKKKQGNLVQEKKNEGGVKVKWLKHVNVFSVMCLPQSKQNLLFFGQSMTMMW